MLLEPEGETAKLNALVEKALPIFEAARADLARSFGYSALGQVAVVRAQADTALASFERAIDYARRAGVRQEYDELAVARGLLHRWHDTRVGRAVVARRERAGARPSPPRVHPVPRRWRCSAASTKRARSSPNHVRCCADRGAELWLAGLTRVSAEVELLAHGPAAAAELGTEA